MCLRKIEWKLKRGSWRPKLLEYAKSVVKDEIEEASRLAFAALDVIQKGGAESFERSCASAMAPLTKIKVRSRLVDTVWDLRMTKVERPAGLLV